MEESFEILIKNYDRINKKYFLGKQEIDTINYQELVILLKELPFNSEKFAVPIQIITHDLIIEKKYEKKFVYKYNRPFPYNIRLSKKEFELNEFKFFFDNKEHKTVEYFISFLYVTILFFFWFYFVLANSQSIFILIGQNFGTMTINFFLLWLFLVSIGGSFYFIYDSGFKPFRLKTIKLKFEENNIS